MSTLRNRVGFTSPTLGANAYKRLGVRAADISRNIFSPPQTGNAYANGKVVRGEFFGFWGQLSISESNDAKQFFESLLDQIRENDARQQAAITANAAAIPTSTLVNGIPQASIYNTIAFMLCISTVRLDADKLIMAYNTYVDPARDPMRHWDSPGLRNLMKMIAIRTQTDQSDEHVLSPFVMNCTHLIPKEARLQDWFKQATIDENDIQSNEHGFIYNYLMTLLTERPFEVAQPLLKAVYDKAHSLPQQARMSMPNAEQSLFAVLHLMKQILSSSVISDVEFIERGIRILRSFTLWQQPFGRLAENMVQYLKSEMLCPGASRRALIKSENLVVDYGTTSGSGATAPIQSLYRHTKPIFYLHDNLDATVSPLLNVIDAQTLQALHLVRPQVTMVDPTAGQQPPAAVLTQSLMNAFEAISPKVAFTLAEVQAIQNMSQEKIISFSKRLHEFEGKFQLMIEQGQWTMEGREAEYMNLKNDIMKVAKQSSGPAMFQVPFNNDGTQPIAQLPVIEHVRVPIDLKSKTNEHDGSSSPGYPAVGMYEKLLQILQGFAPDPSLKFDNGPDSPKLREIRFVLIGNDKLLQHVITAYYLLQSNNPNAFHGLDVKFFLVPCAKNLLANYIAKHDLWYFRHIFSPFRSPFPYLLPFLRDLETEVHVGNNEHGLVGYPTTFLRDSITQYVREAQHTFKTVVFKLEGRTDLNSNEPSDVIPFIQRVEIGLTPTVEEFKAKQGQSSAKLEDILKDKTFIYSPIEFTIRYFKIDLSNQPKPEIVDDPIPYQSIILSHVPRKGDVGNVADPSSKGLELSVNPAAKIDKSKLKKNSLFYDPRQHIAEITCTSPTPFKVLTDGVLHGPYRQVRVCLAQNKADGKIAQFPVQTFFPIPTSP